MSIVESLEITERRKRAVALKLGGATWDQVAQQLGYSDRGSACKDVARALEQSREELRQDAETLRALQIQRYERLLMAVWPQAIQGDLRANEAAARHVDRISDLLGLKAPVQHEVITVDALTARARILAEQLGIPVPERFALGGGGEGAGAVVLDHRGGEDAG